ncbi:hypothetical protein F5144DRAFT_589364 [Chaetomium tenue]|uniref:Uncharacterized protein n=1 Tax=Chaetomium tenue TaxID=1854479 RepID=A0ACB7PQH1_9PEZI|nr:hypothetical protein F5144DRAFT_589364 [Chaetomium globosum]
MVGVPRSKGCITCRKRRKRCRKAGLACEGYSAERVFVVSTPRSRQAGYRASPTPSSVGLPWQRIIQQNQVSSNITNLRLLARPEDERRCIDQFWEAYFSSGQPIPDSAARSYTCTWTETARKFDRGDDCLRYALWANCLLVTGKRHGTVWMLRVGSRFYGEALANLRNSLGGTRGPRRGTLIATIKLLSMFEVWVTTPAAHIDGEAHHMFADERVEMRLVLGAPEWKSIPWQKVPKDFKDILVDVLVDMPQLVEEFDNMRLCADATKRAALQVELEQKCWEHDQQLLAWLASSGQFLDPRQTSPHIQTRCTMLAISRHPSARSSNPKQGCSGNKA